MGDNDVVRRRELDRLREDLRREIDRDRADAVRRFERIEARVDQLDQEHDTDMDNLAREHRERRQWTWGQIAAVAGVAVAVVALWLQAAGR